MMAKGSCVCRCRCLPSLLLLILVRPKKKRKPGRLEPESDLEDVFQLSTLPFFGPLDVSQWYKGKLQAPARRTE